MKFSKSILGALITSLFTAGIVFGALMNTVYENSLLSNFVVPTPTNEPADIYLQTAGIPTLMLKTPQIQIITATATTTSTQLLPSPSACPAPAGWQPYFLQFGDSLELLAIKFSVSKQEIVAGNCLESSFLVPDSIIFLPEIPFTLTPTLIPSSTSSQCGPPSGWVTYTIQRNDTLFELSIRYGVSVSELQSANCMGNSTILVFNQIFYVPFVINTMATATNTLTILATNSVITITATPIPTRTITNAPTFTPTIFQTATFTQVSTAAFTSTPTPIPTGVSESPTSTPITATVEPTPIDPPTTAPKE